MVAFTQEEKAAVSAAVTAAEKRTSAEIAVVVSPVSDTYQAYLLVHGFIVGSIVCGALWWFKTVTLFPLLLVIQAAVMGVFTILPFCRTLVLKCVKPEILNAHAARRAAQEYLNLSRQVPADRPVVLLYVSEAEKYAHILYSRAVAQKIPSGLWDRIIADFTSTVKSSGLKDACLNAITRTATTLEPFFPDKGEENVLADDIMEKP